MKTPVQVLAAPIQIQLQYALEKIADLLHRVQLLEEAIEELDRGERKAAEILRQPFPEDRIESIVRLNTGVNDPGPSTSTGITRSILAPRRSRSFK